MVQLPITSLTIRCGHYPLESPFSSSVIKVDAVHLVLLELNTKEGAIGTAYGFGFSKRDAKMIATALEALADVVIGEDVMMTVALWRRMLQALAFSGQGGASLAALSVIDMAAWDAKARFMGHPLHLLLGGARDSIPAYASAGSLSLSTEGLVGEMAGFHEAGFFQVKMKLGPTVRQNVERVGAVRSELGDGPTIYVDGNQQWSLPDALQMADEIRKFSIGWFEEPLPANQIDELSHLRKTCAIPIATGETNFGLEDFNRIINARAADIVMPNLQRVGGVTGWRQIADAAGLRGIGIASHVATPFALSLLASVDNAVCLEYVPWWPDPFRQPVRIENGMAFPSSEAGFGRTIDEACLNHSAA